MSIRVKRVYEAPEKEDGYRALVDHLWPRGIKKEDAHIDHWFKEIAPTDELRKWFGHEPEKWEEFKRRYFLELDKNRETAAKLAKKAKAETVTLVFSSKEERFNNAVALKEYLENKV
ncbi:MAG: DUF488 family protein [Desulfomonilaceae bacterium]